VPFLSTEFVGARAAPSIQMQQMVLGLLYSFIINTPSADGTKEHHLTVTRDRNKDFHLCKKISRTSNSGSSSASSSSLTCRRADVFQGSVSSPETLRTSSSKFYCGLAHGGAGATSLKIASYNIWNVNMLRQKGETYEKRMQRLGKVSWLAADVC